MEQLITNLGFPIACVVGLALYFVQKDKANREDNQKMFDNLREDNKMDREMYRETINKFDDKLDRFGLALEQNNNKLGQIEDDIKIIKEKVGV